MMLVLWTLCASAQTDSPPTDPAPTDPAPLVVNPEIVTFYAARDPQIARTEEVSVRLLLEIDATGAVSGVTLLDGASLPEGEAAIAAARTWRFRPAEDSTGPVPVEIEFTYFFPVPAAIKPPEEIAPQQTISLTGRLLQAGSRDEVDGALVRALGPEPESATLAEAVTDADGHFVLALPDTLATVELSVRRPGYQDLHKTLELSPGEEREVTLWVRALSSQDNELVVLYSRYTEPQVTQHTISIEEVRRIPGTFGDPVRVIQSLPGSARAPFGTGLLILRGANPDDSNVYIDGVEVPIVYHLGGYRSVLNPDLIDTVDYLPGGYGVRYGRSLGGAVDVHTKSDFSESPRVTIRSDILDAGAFSEGSVGKLGYAIGARRSYIDVLLGLVLRKAEFSASPRWVDYQLKLARLGGPGELSLLLFGFDDQVVVRADGDTRALGVGYSTHRAVLSFRQPLTETLSVWVQPSVGVVGSEYGLGNNYLFDLNAEIASLRAELSFRPAPVFSARIGLDAEASRNEFSLFIGDIAVNDDDPLSEVESLDLGRKLRQTTPDPFAEISLTPTADPDALALIAGVRMPWLIRERSDRQHAFDPRLQLRYRPFSSGLFRGTTLKAGTGLYHQPPTGIEIGRDQDLDRAASSEVGVEQVFTPALRVDMTGYHRYIGPPRIFKPKDAEEERDSIGRAYGVETMVRLSPVGRAFGWVSYTLSKSEFNSDPDDPEEPAPWIRSDFDQTHIFTTVAGYSLPYNFSVSGKGSYVTGNPYTPLEEGIYLMDQGSWVPFSTGEPNSERQPPYWSVDLRVDKRFTFRQWSLLLFVDFLNTLRGPNPEFPLYSYDFSESDYIRGLPFIPALGFLAEMNF